MQNNEVGIIVEQGFVAGLGLGYNPVNLNNNDKKNESCENEQAE